ncbi:hypothetical protein DPMN_032560 [Dreissena polymorpha]|uniref:Uncharacterized protein n=1 Tax=Dreissena polymorpha TaxID=45954 RepID=A0A9D4M6U1_DREPO|nr:hypothetical protein DPMN_032560 [Dreissena polymorpha]
MVRSAPLLIEKPKQTPKQNLSRLNHGAVATHAPQISAPCSSWGRNNPGQCLLRGKLCKVGSGPECCGSDNAYGSKVPLCCTLIASSSGRSDFGLCQPKNPGITCVRR